MSLLFCLFDRRESEEDLWDDVGGGGVAGETTGGLHGVEGVCGTIITSSTKTVAVLTR